MAPRVAIIGGGITGLVAALRLSQQKAEVVLVEAGDRLGGKIQTRRLAGATIELGADAFLPRDERPLQLCREVGLEHELTEPADFGAWIFHGERLHRMPAGTLLGAPTSLAPVATTSLLSWRGKARAALDLAGTGPLRGPDVSVASLIRSRLGAEVLERMVDPLLAGTRAGDVSEMSLAAAIPPIDQAARAHGSLIRGLRQATSTGSRPSFHAPRDGMSRLVEGLEAKLQTVEILKRRRVQQVARDGSGFRLEVDGGPVQADAVLITAPSYAAADLVRDIAPDAAQELVAIPHASAAVVNLSFGPDQVALPPGGSGVLVPSSERMTLSGCTWFSKKWPAHAAPNGAITVRCFVGRSNRDPALELDDDDLVGVVATELARVIEVSAEPIDHHVHRWERGLPQYKVGHLERVGRIETLLAGTGPLAVAGASYRGSGIPDCIAQAETASASLLERVRR